MPHTLTGAHAVACCRPNPDQRSDQRGLSRKTRLLYQYKVDILCRRLLGPDVYRVGGLQARRTEHGMLVENLFAALANADIHANLHNHLSAEEVAAFNERSCSQNGVENYFNMVRQKLTQATAESMLQTQHVREQVTIIQCDPNLLEGETAGRVHCPGSRWQLYENQAAARAEEDTSAAWDDGTAEHMDSEGFKKYSEKIQHRALTEVNRVKRVREFHKV